MDAESEDSIYLATPDDHLVIWWLENSWDLRGWSSGDRLIARVTDDELDFIHRWSESESVLDYEPTELSKGLDEILDGDHRPNILAIASLRWVFRWSWESISSMAGAISQRLQVLAHQSPHPVIKLCLEAFPLLLVYRDRAGRSGVEIPGEQRLLGLWPLIMAYEGSAGPLCQWLNRISEENFSTEAQEILGDAAAVDHVESGRAGRSSLPEENQLRRWVEFGLANLPLTRNLGFTLRLLCSGRPISLIREKILQDEPNEFIKESLDDLLKFGTQHFTDQKTHLAGARSLTTTTHTSSLLGHSYIRMALTVGDLKTAQDLLHHRTASHLRGAWIDAFFLSRIHLAQGDLDLAAKRFTQAYESARAYDAIPRIEFEMRCATEVSPLHWAALVQESSLSLQDTTVSKHRWNALVFKGESKAVRSLRERCAIMLRETQPITAIGVRGVGVGQVARWFAGHRTPGGHVEYLTISGTSDQSIIEALLGIGDASIGTPTAGILERCVHGTVVFEQIQKAGPALQHLLLEITRTGTWTPINGRQARQLQARFVFTANMEDDGQFADQTMTEAFIELLDQNMVVVPRLDQRQEDIEPISRSYVRALKLSGSTLDDAFFQEVGQQSWPGNLPQLTAFLRSKAQKNDPKTGTIRRRSEPGESITSFFSRPKTAQSIEEKVDEAIRSPREKRMDTLRTLLQRYSKLTRRQVMTGLGVSPATATKYLQELCQEGFLKKVEPTPAPRTHYYERVGNT